MPDIAVIGRYWPGTSPLHRMDARAKLLLASLALERADVLILDEPARNLPPPPGPVVRGMLRAFGGAVLRVSHDRKFLSEDPTRPYEPGTDGLTDSRA